MGYAPYGGNYSLFSKALDLPNISRHLPEIKTPLAQLEGFAYDHRYELKSSEHLVARSQSMVESEKGAYFPTLSLKGDYSAQSVDREYLAATPQRQWQAGVDLKWNLFAGQQTDASVQEAKISAMKAASQVDRIRLKIKREVIEARLYVMRMKDAVILSESIAKSSEKKYMQAKKRYENDLSDYIELQEAQQGYIRSLSELVVSYYDYYIAVAQLDYAVSR
jgi:outer membrane protein